MSLDRNSGGTEMRERLHRALRSFFGEDFPAGRGRREAVNRALIQAASRALGVAVEIDPDRHYGQSDRAIFRLVPGCGLVDRPRGGSRIQQLEAARSAGGEFWELFLLLSDLGPWMHLSAHRCRLDDAGKLNVSAPPPGEWPADVQTAARAVRSCFIQAGIEEPPSELLDEPWQQRDDYPVLDSPATVFTHLFGEV